MDWSQAGSLTSYGGFPHILSGKRQEAVLKTRRIQIKQKANEIKIKAEKQQGVEVQRSIIHSALMVDSLHQYNIKH